MLFSQQFSHFALPQISYFHYYHNHQHPHHYHHDISIVFFSPLLLPTPPTTTTFVLSSRHHYRHSTTTTSFLPFSCFHFTTNRPSHYHQSFLFSLHHYHLLLFFPPEPLLHFYCFSFVFLDRFKVHVNECDTIFSKQYLISRTL